MKEKRGFLKRYQRLIKGNLNNELDNIIKEITDRTQFEDNSLQLPLTFPIRN